MAKKRSEPRKTQTPTTFEQARDELFSHILRCGVLEAGPEHQKPRPVRARGLVEVRHYSKEPRRSLGGLSR